MSDYPECDKMVEAQPESQRIGEFIEWLADVKKIHLAKYVKYENVDDTRLAFCGTPIEELLAEYFQLDLAKVELEKRAILKAIRQKQEAP